MKPQEQEDPAKGGEDWRERFDEQVPWHDGIRDNYVYVKDVEPFIESELKRAKAEEREKVQRERDAVHIVDLYEIRYPLIRKFKYPELPNSNELIQKIQLDLTIARLIDKYSISTDDIKEEIYKRSFSTPQEGDNNKKI